MFLTSIFSIFKA